MIERIIDQRTVGGATLYLVKWKGYDDETWETEENLADTAALEAWLAAPAPEAEASSGVGGGRRGGRRDIVASRRAPARGGADGILAPPSSEPAPLSAEERLAAAERRAAEAEARAAAEAQARAAAERARARR